MNNRVTKFLLETNVITSDEIEIYQYGFDLIVKNNNSYVSNFNNWFPFRTFLRNGFFPSHICLAT